MNPSIPQQNANEASAIELPEELIGAEVDYEAYDVEKGAADMMDDGDDDDNPLADEDDDFEIVDDDDGFTEADHTWGSNLSDTSFGSTTLRGEVMGLAHRPGPVSPQRPPVVASGDMANEIRILHSDTLETLISMDDAPETINVLQWNADGTYLAAGTLSNEKVPGRVLIYRICDDGTEAVVEQAFDGPGDDVEWLAWHPRGPCIIAGFSDGTIWVWMTKSGNLHNVLVGHGGATTCGVFVDEGKKAVTGSSDGGVIVWSLNTASIDFHLLPNAAYFGTYDIDWQGGHSNAIISIAAHPFLPLVATGSEDNTVKIINYKTQKVVKTLSGFTDTTETLQWLPMCAKHHILAAASLDGSVVVWNGDLNWRPLLQAAHGAPKDDSQGIPLIPEGTKEPNRGGVTKILWILPHSRVAQATQTQDLQVVNELLRKDARLASISLDGTLRVWSFSNETPAQVYGGSSGALIALTSRSTETDEMVVFMGGDDRRVRAIKIQ